MLCVQSIFSMAWYCVNMEYDEMFHVYYVLYVLFSLFSVVVPHHQDCPCKPNHQHVLKYNIVKM
jgi:hypothetical protein